MHGNKAISIEALLSHVPLLSSLGPQDLARLAAGSREVPLGKGDILFRKGDMCDGVHVVVVGRVKLVFTSAEGINKVVEILGQGQTYGESLMLAEQPYEVSAEALSDSILLHISKAVIFEEFDKDPQLRLKMLAGMSRRLRGLMDDMESYSLHSGKQRVVRYFLHLLPEGVPSRDAAVTLPTSKAIIASRLNLTQEHFSRVLRELSGGGLIEVQGSKILIPDVEQLRAQEG